MEMGKTIERSLVTEQRPNKEQQKPAIRRSGAEWCRGAAAQPAALARSAAKSALFSMRSCCCDTPRFVDDVDEGAQGAGAE